VEEIGERQKQQYFGFQQKQQQQRGIQRHQADYGRMRNSGDCRDDLPTLSSANGRHSQAMVQTGVRVKPGKEIYRPPTGNWNIEAQEFKPLAPAPLTMTRSMSQDQVTGDRRPDTRNRHVETNIELDLQKLSVFGKDMEEIIAQTLEDPNGLSARSHMELVRQIFTKVVETQKISELAAKFCIYIIERERKETFLESLLNTCQEWYHERDRIIKSEKWAAFMSFLNELYGLLKRKQVHLQSKYEGVAPKLVLLTLLAECCIVTLTKDQMSSIPETEVLFLVLTHIQRDLITEAPGQMSLIVNCLREAFLTADVPQQVRKTLLQLLELQSAGWQLPAEAVMYYYPGAKL